MADEPDLIPAGSLDDLLGFEGYEFDGEGVATARMPVHAGVKQPFGIVHGGAYASLAESLVSRATFEGAGEGMIAMGQANESIFLRPIRSGTVNARARALHRGTDELGLGRRDDRRRGPPVRDLPPDHRRQTTSRLIARIFMWVATDRPGEADGEAGAFPRGHSAKRLVIGRRRSRPNAFVVIFTPGGACRRLYSARSTRPATRIASAWLRPAATRSARLPSPSM